MEQEQFYGHTKANEPTVAVPRDIYAIISAVIVDRGSSYGNPPTRYPLIQVEPQRFMEMVRAPSTGIPERYCLLFGEIALYPIPDAAYTVDIHYVTRPPVAVERAKFQVPPFEFTEGLILSPVEEDTLAALKIEAARLRKLLLRA